MDKLPVEVLSHILKFLSFGDRREFALVSSKCYEATFHPSLQKQSTYIVYAPLMRMMTTTAEENCYNSSEFHWKCPNVQIHDLDDYNVKSMLQSYEEKIIGPHVQKLVLRNCEISGLSFLEILKHCDLLKSLDLCGCNTLFEGESFLNIPEEQKALSDAFQNIKHLNLSSIRYLTHSSLAILFNLCPKLSALSLSYCKMFFSEHVSTRDDPITFSKFLNLVTVRSSTLTHLDLSRTAITSFALKSLSSVKGLQLYEIALQNCRELDDEGVVELAKSQRSLRLVDVSGCVELGSPSVSALCSYTLNLKEMRFGKCQKINNSSILKLNFLHKLRVVDISECYNVTAQSICSVLEGLSSLDVLYANGCNFFKLESYLCNHLLHNKLPSTKAEKSFPKFFTSPSSGTSLNLMSLSMNSGRNVTDATVQCIFTHLTQLQYLSLAWCQHVTDNGLLGVKSQEEFLAHEDNAEGEPPDIEQCLKERGIQRLRRLRDLSLSNCSKITDSSLKHVFSCKHATFPDMERLCLNMLPVAVTDKVLRGIAVGCPLLIKLHISSCSSITDQGLKYVTKHLHRLETLNVSNCDSITSRFLSDLPASTKWLREIDVSSCKRISSTSVEELKKKLPLINNVHTRYLGGENLIKSL